MYLTHTLNVGICPLKKEILNELIINYEILIFFFLPYREETNCRENGISTMTPDLANII